MALTIPNWAAMWAIAFAVFFGCKSLTWTREAPREQKRGKLASAAAYFLAWPGMDPAAFLRRGRPHRVPLRGWIKPVMHIALAVVLVWVVVPSIVRAHPLPAGWIGMIGLVLLLHCGVFELLALLWQSRGADAAPVIRAPSRAGSLADFWGNRWNTAFHHLALRYIFRPLRRRLGAAGATVATFAASGLVHDLVISVPALGGYCLPTLYFLIQGVAVLVERAIIPARLQRLFWPAIVIMPLPLLFHQPFITRVILPFLEVIQ